MEYIIKHGRIAAVQYIKTPQGEDLTAVYMSEEKTPEITRSGSAKNLWQELPLQVQAAINRQFGAVFSLPYDAREKFVVSSVPFTVNVPLETVTYTLPAFWACPLINGDESGLSDEESEAMQAWLDSEAVGACVGVSDSEFFAPWHDAIAFALPCGCLEFTFYKG